MSEIFETLFSQLRSRRPVETPFVMLFLNLSFVRRYEIKNKKYRGIES